MKKLSKSDAELKKSVAYKKNVYPNFLIFEKCSFTETQILRLFGVEFLPRKFNKNTRFLKTLKVH